MDSLLEVKNLEVSFASDIGDITRIDNVSFHVKSSEILCIVGESGSGKSVTSLSLMGLLSENGKITKGSIEFDGQNLLDKTEKELDRIRGNQLTMIFQDAITSLNPVFRIGTQMIEAMQVHLKLNKKEAKEKAISLLNTVGLPNPEAIMKKYPHTLSGGMRQRVMIAMALTCHPKLLIADEPTTALDVTIQAQIMELIRNLRNEFQMSVILITHDMGLVAEMADRVLVMYAGQIVEEATVTELFCNPLHPYTKALLKAIPNSRSGKKGELISMQGSVPENYYEILGCRFANRCPFVQEQCKKAQALIEVEENHKVRCYCTDFNIEEIHEMSLKEGIGSSKGA